MLVSNIQRQNIYRCFFKTQVSSIPFIYHSLLYLSLYRIITCCIYQEYYSQKERKKETETEKEKTKSMMHLMCPRSHAFWHFWASPSCQCMQNRKKKRKEKKGGRKTYQSEPIHWLHPTGNSTPVVSLKRVVGRTQKSWEGHRWVMHEMWVQAVIIIVNTLRWCCCFSFWPSEHRGMQGWCSDGC